VHAFSALLAVSAGVLAWTLFPPMGSVTATALLVAAVLVAAFALAESVVLHFEIGESAHSASLNELPLVLGLFWLPAPLLVLARVSGAFVGLRFYRRQSTSKLVFNLSMMTLEAVVAVVVFQALVHAVGPRESLLQLWVIAMATCLVSSTVGSLAVLCVISLSTGSAQFSDLRKLLRTGTLTAVGNATAAYIAVDAVRHDTTALLPLALLGGGLTLAYRSHVQLRSRHDRLASLYGFVRGVSAADDGEGIVRNVLAHAREVLKAEVATLTLVEHGAGGRQVLHSYTLDGEGAYRADSRPATDADWPLSRALSTGQPMLGVRGTRDRAVADHLADLGLRDCALAVVPGDAAPAGTLLVGSRRGEHSTFEPADVLALEGLAGHAAVALRNGRLLDRLTHESRHDMLTGLPNRTEFERRLSTALVGDDGLAVLFMDLDRFKDVNDTLGHHAGDELLIEVAHRLGAAVDRGCTVARLGGDEFGVLLTGTSRTSAVRIAQRVKQVLERPVGVEGLSVDVGVSIGLSLAPEHGTTAGVLMRRADIAMYDAKALHGVAVYDPARDDSSTSRLALVAQLRQALAEDGFVLHYQPQLRATDASVLRFEALIRWPSPRGLVPPDDFLPVAERAGLLQGLTTWVLSRALDDLVTWRAAGHDCGVAVNLSPRNLLEAGLAAGVRRLLRERSLPPDCLTLEITEGSIMAEPERALETLSQLRTIGVRLSVDDFGTGYSSLAYLRRLPVDEVKIDKSFVRQLADDEQDAAIVNAVVTLAGSLSLTVVAEGVEDQASWDRLVELDCDVVQGYHISRPMPAGNVLDWLDGHAVLPAPHGVTPLFGGLPRPRSLA
jgi:diguanylate cyclase (GGDEF)-like protein